MLFDIIMRDRPLLVIAVLIAAGTFLFLRFLQTPDAALDEESPVQTVSLATDEFGVPISELSVIQETVRRNETFSDLLTPYDVGYERIVNLAREGRDVFDVRRLKSGRPYRVYTDSSGTGRYLVYQPNLASYVVFDLGEEPSIRMEERDVLVRQRSIDGVIEESLYMTLIGQDIHPTVANRMADVFAWQIDFSRLQKGDSFRILFEEQYVGDHLFDIGDVLAARFVHRGEDYFAFHYQNDVVDEHYDETGKSLRKAFLIAPVEYKRISSGFTRRRFHPVQKRYKAHLGTDYAADPGTPINATGDGVVTEARYGQYNGNYVKIRHNGTFTTQYLHMSKIKSGIRPGVRVKQGDVIGFVGSTGLATGPHVCYRFWKNGEQVDHRREKIPSVGPIPSQYLANFNVQRDDYLLQLTAPINPTIDRSYAELLETPEAVTSP
jgi:murein DD-endopeptidase MepM/ murein hydrolase activator NlpD